LKYSQLQKILSNPFRANKSAMRNFCALVFATCHAPQPLKAHKVKIVDQMMPKAASGGFQAGCFKPKYQGPMSVKVAPTEATNKLHPNAIAKPVNRFGTIMF
jgi:hypothetical protein